MKSSSFKWLYRHTKRVRASIFAASVLGVFTSLCTVFFALIMRDLIDKAVAGDFSGVRQYSVFIILLTIFLYIAHVLSQLIRERAAVSSMMELRQFLISALIKKSYDDIQKKHSGQWINMLFSDIRIISEGVSSIIPSISSMLSRLLFALVTLLMLEPVLALIFLAGGACILIGVGLFRGKLKALHKDVQTKEDALHALVQEIVENILVIKVFGAEKHFEDRTAVSQRDYSSARIKRRKYRLISINMFSFAFRLGYLAALIYGVYQLIAGRITYGTLTAVLHIVSQMQTPIFNLSGILPRIYETAGSVERIMVIDTLEEEASVKTADKFLHMTANDVSFAYDREDVIDNISLEIEQNDIVALTGTSGGGKSTLFLLLLGIYKPNKGIIQIETDQGIYEPGEQTRQLFAYVPQGNSLFTGTIQDNVVFNHEYDALKLAEALKTAEAFDFVNGLPMRELTEIGEKGTGLSEGQMQRIAIARAIYSKAPILLLDESTSALDEKTEARVLNNIRQMKNTTVLIVTHRPAALKICTKHMLIDNLKIKEINPKQQDS